MTVRATFIARLVGRGAALMRIPDVDAQAQREVRAERTRRERAEWRELWRDFDRESRGEDLPPWWPR